MDLGERVGALLRRLRLTDAFGTKLTHAAFVQRLHLIVLQCKQRRNHYGWAGQDRGRPAGTLAGRARVGIAHARAIDAARALRAEAAPARVVAK